MKFILILLMIMLSPLLTQAKITEAEFNQTLDFIETVYAPILLSENGIKFNIDRRWTDQTQNLYSFKKNDQIVTTIYGGFARADEIKVNSLILAVCDSAASFLAGPPYGFESNPFSVPGQAEYFAAAKCAKRILGANPNLTKPDTQDDYAASLCHRSHENEKDEIICENIAAAGLEGGLFLHRLLNGAQPPPSLLTPDRRVVDKTITGYLSTQCRVDTYFAGALCDADPAAPVDSSDPYKGYCPTADRLGARPRCWYAP